MGGKKKTASAKAWTLAGEPVYSSAPAPAEERVFKETVSRFRRIVSQMKDKHDRFSGAGAAGDDTGNALLSPLIGIDGGLPGRESLCNLRRVSAFGAGR